MPHCPYCFNILSKSDLSCSSCGAEKGYVHVRNRARGLVFLAFWGLIAPWPIVLAILLIFRNIGLPVTMAALLAVCANAFSVYRIVGGAAWYR